MTQSKRLAALGIVLTVLTVVILSGCRSETTAPVPAASRPAPGPDRSAELSATNLPALNAPAKALGQYKGRGGLVAVFVDTGCPYAAQVIATINDIPKTLDPRGIPVVLVNLDDPKASVEEFYAEHAVKVPVLYDVTTSAKERWKVTKVPTVVLLDASGQEFYFGPAEWPNVARAVEGMLTLPAGAVKFTPAGTGFG